MDMFSGNAVFHIIITRVIHTITCPNLQYYFFLQFFSHFFFVFSFLMSGKITCTFFFLKPLSSSGSS